MSDQVHDFLNDSVTWTQHQGIFPRSPRFQFFDVMLKKPDWENAKILDIGGNRGNFLQDGIELKKIDAKNYFCLDVDKEALDYGRTNFPDANWVSHNAFNHMYNSSGVEDSNFPFEDNTFDYILAYSVYSHTTFEQLVFDINEMRRVCKPGGKVAFTVIDKLSAEYFTTKRKTDYPNKTCLTHEQILYTSIEDYKYFVDNDLLLDQLYNKNSVNHLVTIYNTDWLINYFSPEIKLEMKFPLNGHIQKTMVFANE